MIKAMYRWFKNLWEKEIDYTFELEFSIYDVLFLAALLLLGWYFLLNNRKELIAS